MIHLGEPPQPPPPQFHLESEIAVHFLITFLRHFAMECAEWIPLYYTSAYIERCQQIWLIVDRGLGVSQYHYKRRIDVDWIELGRAPEKWFLAPIWANQDGLESKRRRRRGNQTIKHFWYEIVTCKMNEEVDEYIIIKPEAEIICDSRRDLIWSLVGINSDTLSWSDVWLVAWAEHLWIIVMDNSVAALQRLFHKINTYM